ncbi:MAG: YciI family protein [Candidatus Rokubacteria bacterium]|nr:YciI family protein [Candidatus Rokubacteria bacterium]
MANRRPEDMMATVKEYVAVADDLRQNGQMVVAERLQPAATATAVRVRDGKTLTTDGPFAETKEQLGGFYLIDVKGVDEAVRVAARLPAARNGCVEVRPIHAM